MEIFDYYPSKMDRKARIFPDHIRDDPWVLFHGTSSCWENQIDSKGLDSGHLPVTLDNLRKLLGVFKSMNWRSASGVGELCAWSFPPDVAEVQEKRSIFLTCVPELAAHYSGRNAAGGEVSQMVRVGLQSLRTFIRDKEVRAEHLIFQLQEYEEALGKGRHTPILQVRQKWVRSKLLELQPLEQRLSEFLKAHKYGLVYALRFEPGDSAWVFVLSDTYIAERSIPASRIIAKARIHGKECDHLDRWPTRHYGDDLNLSSIEGMASANQKLRVSEVNSGQSCKADSEWDFAPIDLTAGKDLTRSMSHESICRYLKGRYPQVFSEMMPKEGITGGAV